MESLIVPLVTIIGAGVSAFVGVKVALAEMRGEIQGLKDKSVDHGNRIDRLERPYFSTGD